MSKIVYLLGAGASYGKRNEGEPKNSPKRIVGSTGFSVS
jgi:hypothetical protein